MKNPLIITHSGNFHSDDIFAVATLKLLMPEAEVIRTRDEEVIKTGDYVLDTGGEYDEKNNRFDHHQQGRAGMRENGVPYASFGLIWKKFGKMVCNSDEVALRIEKKLVTPIDAMDNGMELIEPKVSEVMPYTIQHFVFSFYPTWKETTDNNDKIFMSLVKIAEDLLKREIKMAKDAIEAIALVEKAYNESVDKSVIVLDNKFPLEAVDVLTKHPEPLFVVKPAEQSNTWKANAIRRSLYFFEVRKSFPESWAGKRDEELAKASGVPDATFCHNGLFLAVAKSKEGAIALAKKAVEA